jgi:hypothetical protein
MMRQFDCNVVGKSTNPLHGFVGASIRVKSRGSTNRWSYAKTGARGIGHGKR